MVSVRKRGKVYEYRFETGMVDGKNRFAEIREILWISTLE